MINGALIGIYSKYLSTYFNNHRRDVLLYFCIIDEFSITFFRLYNFTLAISGLFSSFADQASNSCSAFPHVFQIEFHVLDPASLFFLPEFRQQIPADMISEPI